jgi:hypothetical protein
VCKQGRRRASDRNKECELVDWFELAKGRSQWRVFEVTETSSINADNFLTVRGTLQERSYTTLGTCCSSHTRNVLTLLEAREWEDVPQNRSSALQDVVLPLDQGFPKFLYHRSLTAGVFFGGPPKY